MLIRPSSRSIYLSHVATPTPPCDTEVNVASVKECCLKAQSPNVLQIPSGGGGGGGGGGLIKQRGAMGAWL